MNTTQKLHQVNTYAIKINGYLEPSWLDWCEDLSIIIQQGETTLVGILSDQEGLSRILNNILADGRGLISVNKINP